jgi:hypothetical protein
MTMNRYHIDDRGRQCHRKEWREIKNKWNQVRKNEEPDRQSERVKAAELERRAQLSPSKHDA